MTVINSSSRTNNLTPSTQISTSTATSESTSKISTLASKLYLGPGYTNVPGITNLFYAPGELYDGIKATYRAYQIGDQEGIVENSLRIAQVPFSVSNALLQIAWYVLSAGVFFKILKDKILTITAPIPFTVAGLGLGLCAVETVLESIGLYRTIKFYKEEYPFDFKGLKESIEEKDPAQRQLKISKSLREISKRQLPPEIQNEIQSFLEKNDLSQTDITPFSETVLKSIEEKVYLSQLTKLHENYFQISPKKEKKIRDYVEKQLEGKTSQEKEERIHLITQANLQRYKNNLIRRVHPWLANKIEESVPHIIQNLQSPQADKKEEAMRKAESIFKDIRIQSQKKLMIHIIGLVALALTIAGLIVGCFSCPFLIPFALLMIGSGLSFVRYYLHCGFMDSEGWNFSIENCIPKPVKKIYRKVFPLENARPSSSTVALPYVLPGAQKPIAVRNYEKTLSRLNFRMAKA